jgi:hypothetical protein
MPRRAIAGRLRIRSLKLGFPTASGKDEPFSHMTSFTRRFCLLLILGMAFAAPAYPWGRQGHQAMAAIAVQNLTPDALGRVKKILGNDDLPAIAVWMDELRSAAMHAGPLAFNAEAQRFIREFPQNGEWHYVDLPLGTKAYDPDDPFSNPHDVVHAIAMAVDVLEGHGDARITRKEALYMLVHFVGDEHQPLHIGNGYYQLGTDGTAKLVTDPAAASGLPNDKGGNALFFGAGRFDELHAYWDTALVVKVANSEKTADLVKVLQGKVAAEGAAWKSAGDYHDWPRAWATESLAPARIAYAGIVFGAVTRDPKGGITTIRITLPAHYDDVCMPIAEERLAQSGYHLAEILNALHWAD